MPYVQSKALIHTTGQGAVNHVDVVLDNPASVGNRLIVIAANYGSGVTQSQVTDNQGNGGTVAGKYDQLLVQTDPFNGKQVWWSAQVATAGTTTITVTLAGGTTALISVLVLEYYQLALGAGVAAIVDTSSSGAGLLNTNPDTGATGAAAATGELVLVAVSDSAANISETASNLSAWTIREDTGGSSTSLLLEVLEQASSIGATARETWTRGSTDAGNAWIAVCAVFLSSAPLGGILPQPKPTRHPTIRFLPSVPLGTGPLSFTTTVGDELVSTAEVDLAETATYTDAASPGEGMGFSGGQGTDQATASDTVGVSGAGATDVLTSTETSGAAGTGTLTDAATAADTVGASGIGATDSNTTTDSVTVVQFQTVTVTDSNTLAESLTLAGAASLTDALGTTDTVGPAGTTTLTDAATASDSVGAAAQPQLTDSATSSDTVASSGIGATDVLIVTESVILSGPAVVVTDTSTPADSIGPNGRLTLTDLLAATETVTTVGVAPPTTVRLELRVRDLVLNWHVRS